MNTGSMTCANARDTMMLALYEEAPAAEVAALRAHLYSCRRCSEEWERLASVAQTISHAEGGRPRPALALALPKAAVGRKRFGLVYAAAAAVMFVAIVGASGLVPRLWRALSPEVSPSASLATHPASGATRPASGAVSTTPQHRAEAASAAAVGVASNRGGSPTTTASRTASAGRTPVAASSDASEDVLEAELRSLDSALSTLESGQEEL